MLCDSIYIKHSEQANLLREKAASRLPGAGREAGRGRLLDRNGFSLWIRGNVGTRQRWWLHSIENVLNVTAYSEIINLMYLVPR